MSIYYPSADCGNGVAVPDYYCNPCATYEYGRIRSIALIHSSYIDTLLANPTSSTVWSTGIVSGKIIIIWKVTGSYDGGTTATLPGFGDTVEINGSTTHTVTFKDPTYLNNCDFYDALRNSEDYSIAFRTSSMVHFSEEPCSFSTKNPITENLTDVVTFEVTAKWVNNAIPCPYATPSGIFDTCSIHY